MQENHSVTVWGTKIDREWLSELEIEYLASFANLCAES